MYDFADYEVYTLIRTTHVPEEIVTRPNGLVSLNLVCTQDGERWPCPSRVQLREYEAQQSERQTAFVKAGLTARYEAPLGADTLADQVTRRRIR